MTFRDLLASVMRKTRLNTAYFAQTVVMRFGDEAEDLELAVHVRHTVRMDPRPDGTSTVIEQIRVEIDSENLDAPPDFGHRIYLPGDDYPYMYAYAGRNTPVSYKAVFERRRRTAQAAGRSKAIRAQ